MLVVLLCAGLSMAVNAAPQPLEKSQAAITVTVLGSGTPSASASQFGPAIMVRAGGEIFLFDCGRGCTSRLAQVDPALITSAHLLFLTHLHSDHLTGIPDLWLNGWLQGRKLPLSVAGPRGTTRMMEGLRQAFAADIGFREADGVPAPGAGLDSAFDDLPDTGGIAYDKSGVRITAFMVEHGKVEPAFGYRIEYDGHVVMISGDTTATPSLAQFGKGADVVLLEVVSPALIDVLKRQFGDAQTVKIIGNHLTVEQASAVFAAVRPQLGVYYHTRNDGAFAATLLEQTRSRYPGKVALSHDLMRIEIGERVTIEADPAP